MTDVGGQTLAARRAVRAAVAGLAPGSTVLVAASGGPDSCALAAAAAFVAPRQGLSAGAVIVDHGLQDDSATVAAWAGDVSLRLGLEFADVCRVTVGSDGGPEAAARDARYECLRERAEQHGAVAVLLGHTMDDQAETVLLRLARGSGARSLAGMRPVDGLWRRPFLALPRAVVHGSADEVMARIGEHPWRDPHNEDPRFARVRVRTAVSTLEQALGAGVVPALARTADLLRDDADALDALAGQAFEAYVQAEPDGSSCDAQVLADLPRAVRTRVIRSMCLAAGCDPGTLTAEHVWAVERLVSAWHGQGPIRLPGGVSAERRCGRLSVVRHPSPRSERAT